MRKFMHEYALFFSREIDEISHTAMKHPVLGRTICTVDLDNFVPLFNFSLCGMSSISPKM